MKKQISRTYGVFIPAEEWLLEDYKEPIRPLKNGHGFYGIVVRSKDKELVMSHEDGLFYKHLNTQHAKKFGYKNLKEYKSQYGISQTTPLCGLSISKKNHDKAMGYFAKQGAVQLKKIREKGQQALKDRRGSRMSLEVRNKRGTCPDQLLDKILKLKEKLRYTPSANDFKSEYGAGFLSSIENYFGTYLNAVKSASLIPNSIERPRGYTSQELINRLWLFLQTYGYTPLSKDFGNGILPTKQAYYRYWRTLNAARLNAGVPLVMSFRRPRSGKPLSIEVEPEAY